MGMQNSTARLASESWEQQGSHDAAPVSDQKVCAFFWCDDLAILDQLSSVLVVDAAEDDVPMPDGMLVCELDDPRSAMAEIEARLNVDSRRLVKVLLHQSGNPALTDFAGIRSLEEVLAVHRPAIVGDLVAERRYKSLMQPIVTRALDRVMGFEFLFRGIDTAGDTIPPLSLFETAAREGVANQLDAVACASAVETAARLDLRGNIFVNLLPSTLLQEVDNIDVIQRAVDDSGLPPDQLVVELVELEKIDNVVAMCFLIEELRDRGYRIALDDFGAGFNNLTTLLSLKPDYVKFDKALTRAAADDQGSRALVANMIDAAQQNGIKTIAEGIETEDMADLLIELGIDYLQGYYFGVPLDRADAKNLRR